MFPGNSILSSIKDKNQRRDTVHFFLEKGKQMEERRNSIAARRQVLESIRLTTNFVKIMNFIILIIFQCYN